MFECVQQYPHPKLLRAQSSTQPHDPALGRGPGQRSTPQRKSVVPSKRGGVRVQNGVELASRRRSRTGLHALTP